jgi:hypothetical protein
MFALFGIISKYTSQLLGFWQAQVYFILGNMIVLALFFFSKTERTHLVHTWKKMKNTKGMYLFIINQFFDQSAGFARRYATTFVPVALVSALSSIQYLFILSLGIFFSLFFPKFVEEKVSYRILLEKSLATFCIIV